MSLSYTGLTNYGKTALPSVESWGTNMNILRDPPKSIMTRKQNKDWTEIYLSSKETLKLRFHQELITQKQVI